MMDSLPSIAKVFSYAAHQERQINNNEMIGSTSLINATSTNSLNLGYSCTYFRKDNHIVDRCYRKNGFPHNYASRGGRGNQSSYSKGNSGGKGNKLCIHCDFTNLTIDECYKKHGYPLGHKFQKSQSSNINNVNDVKKEGDNSTTDQNQETHNEEVKLTPQQYKALMTLLQQQGSTHKTSQVNQIGTFNNKGSVLSITCSVSKTSQDEWILDSSATDHVTAFPPLFSLCKKINPIMVRILTGHTVTATYACRIQFSQFLYLEDILYIPNFQFNLISVSKLISSLPCKLTFMNDKCFIQDMKNL